MRGDSNAPFGGSATGGEFLGKFIGGFIGARDGLSAEKAERERERERDINAIEIDDLRDEKWKCNGDSLHRNIIFNSIVTFR